MAMGGVKMTLGGFIANIVTSLDAINAAWATWVVGAVAVGAATKVGPSLVKRFL